MEGVTIVSHPLVQHKLTLLRSKDTSTKSFRELLKEIGMLLCYEVTRDLPLADVEIETPLAKMRSPEISGKKLVFAPVLRAGVTFADGMLDLVPTARVAHIGLYREPQTFTAVEYFFKAPSDLHERLVIVVSPVLATANLSVAAVDRLKERGANDIRLVSLIASPDGSSACAAFTLMFRSGWLRSMRGWTRTPISCRASATPATAPMAPDDWRRSINSSLRIRRAVRLVSE
jgi:uracil phosphoribosyltransferase